MRFILFSHDAFRERNQLRSVVVPPWVERRGVVLEIPLKPIGGQ